MLTALHSLLLALQQPRSVPKAPEPARLVLVVAVDQLIPEQLQRLAPRLSGGFARFLAEGAVFWRATVDYANTETGPGHATLGTGRYPSHHGIVGNVFVERARRTTVYCVGDPEARALTGSGESRPGSSSPVHLVGDGLGDLLEARVPGSKTVTVAGKDRSAVLLGGRKPDCALWWGAGFVSSSYYGEKLPEFAQVWNAAWRERARGWEWVSELGGDARVLGTGHDDRAGEVRLGGGGTLPRTLPDEDAGLESAVMGTPLLDYFTIELASLALDALELGRDDAVDYLGISLSGCDVLGHMYGPDSVEVTDLLLRDDRDLGRFLALLDEKVGKGRWLACLSSDHGVLDLPEVLTERGVGARRVTTNEVAETRGLVKEALSIAYPEAGDLGLAYGDFGFTFDEAAASAAGIEPAAVRELVAEAARESEWVADAYTLEELGAKKPRDAWITLYQRCLFPGRSPDVTLRPEPWLLFEMPAGTSHGTPYPYDRRVPLVFLGGKVKAQQRFDPASPVDAVPTLLGLLGLPLPGDLDGRVLEVD